MISPSDELGMAVALEWSRRGRGWTSPRPSVGCALVRDGQVVGAGHTQKGDGMPHGEIVAIRDAWKNDPFRGPRGATAYVTLEPCSHFGTTPPCCEALAREGIVRVVAGVLDPDKRVQGRGFAFLQKMAIPVESCSAFALDSFRCMDDFLFHIHQSRPFLTLKLATSLDGKIALPSGESRWISGEKSRRHVHQMRHENDAVLVGIETVLSDNPTLDVRLAGRWKQPARIVLDSRARLPLEAKIWDNAPTLWVVTSQHAPLEKVEKLLERGAQVIEVGLDGAGFLAWHELLQTLYARGIFSVLVEGGAKIAGSALQAGVVNKVAHFVAPKILGAGREAVCGWQAAYLSQAPHLQCVRHLSFDDDILVEGYLGALPITL